jgi:xanthine dehydrogenase large subunit
MSALDRKPVRIRRRAGDWRPGALLPRNPERIAWLDESGGIAVQSSTQHPSETQEIVARVLGDRQAPGHHRVPAHGRAFGGKEVQANSWAAVAALGAWKTRRPVRVR